MENTHIAGYGKNGEARPAGGMLSGFFRLLGFLVLSPFLALRGLYWLFDTDSEIRANGERTEGTVLSTKTTTRTYTDPETGNESIVTEHFIRYRYDTPEGSHTARKKVGGLSGMKEGSKIAVYYRTPTDRPVRTKDSAIDWSPRRPK